MFNIIHIKTFPSVIKDKVLFIQETPFDNQYLFKCIHPFLKERNCKTSYHHWCHTFLVNINNILCQIMFHFSAFQPVLLKLLIIIKNIRDRVFLPSLTLLVLNNL